MRFAGPAEAAFFALLSALFVAAFLTPVFRTRGRPKILGDGNGTLSYEPLSLRLIAVAGFAMVALAAYGAFTHPDPWQRVWASIVAAGMGASSWFLLTVADKSVVTWDAQGIARLKGEYGPAASISWDDIESVEDFSMFNVPTAVSNRLGTKISWAGCAGATHLLDELRKRRPDLFAIHSTAASSSENPK